MFVGEEGGFGFRAVVPGGTGPPPFISGGGSALGLLASQSSQSFLNQALVLGPKKNPAGAPYWVTHLSSVTRLLTPYCAKSGKRNNSLKITPPNVAPCLMTRNESANYERTPWGDLGLSATRWVRSHGLWKKSKNNPKTKGQSGLCGNWLPAQLMTKSELNVAKP